MLKKAMKKTKKGTTKKTNAVHKTKKAAVRKAKTSRVENSQISFTVPTTVLSKIDRAAKRTNMNRSTFLRDAVNNAL